MSQSGSHYTLYYTMPTDTLVGVFPLMREANTFIEALSTAWLTREAGEDIQAIGYDGRSILEGKSLQEALDLISERGAQVGTPPTDIVQQLTPELLAKRLARLEGIVTERSGEAVVYRRLLEELYKAADEAIKNRDLEQLFKITGKLAFWYVPSESDVKQWGRDFLHACRRDAGWLHFTKKALEKIKAAAEKIDAPEGTRVAEIKQEIIKVAEDGLIPHI